MDPYTGEIYAEATVPVVRREHLPPGRQHDAAAVHRPGRLERLRAGVGVQDDDRDGRARERDGRPRHPDQGRRHAALDRGQAKVDDADRKGMGWMTFEDARRLLAQRRRREGGPRARQNDPERRRRSSTTGGSSSASARRPASTSPARSPGIVRDPGLQPWAQIDLANGAFGQGVAVTPIQLATAYAALMNGGTTIQPHVVKAIGPTRSCRSSADAPGHRLARSTTAHRAHEPRGHDRPVLQEPDARPRVRGRWQDRDRPDLGRRGSNGGRGGWKVNLFNYSFIGYIARQPARPGSRRRDPHRGGQADRRPGRTARDAGHVVRALPPDRHRRDHDAGPADRPAGRPLVPTPDR